MAARFDDLAQPCVDALDGVGRVDHAAHFGREGEEGNDLVPSPAPSADDGGKFVSPGSGLKRVQLGLGRFGAAILLSVISAGREIANPLELLASKKMQELMAELKHRYKDRYVIIDTPPLLPFAETRALARLVDGVILVIHEGVTPVESVSEAKEILKGSTVLGVVLNDSTAASSDNSHYSGYYGRQAAV